MEANPRISITIPTFNRAEYLDCCLAAHIPFAKIHDIQIFVCDNASTDDTELVVKRRMIEYPLIRYIRNEENIGMDGNFEKALTIPQTEFVWLMGDTYKISPEGISNLLALISGDHQHYDVLVFNFGSRVQDIPEQDYTDRNKLLSDLGWHMTCIASLVFSSKVINNADFKRYRNTCLIHTGIIFDYIGNRNFLIHWNESISVQGIAFEGVNKISWQDRTFEIWTENWSNCIFSLPPIYTLDVKLKCIKDHGIKSGLFSLKNLMILRSNNMFNIKIYKKYSTYFPIAINHSKFILLLISLFPIFILQGIKILNRKMMKKF